MHLASSFRLTAAIALGAALLGAPRSASAQSGDGFLFGTPIVTLTLRGGFDQPFARSDLFTQTFEQFSLSRGSLRGAAFAGDIAVRVAPRLALVGSGGYSGRRSGSHFRHFVDLNDREINQTASLVRAPFTLGLRGYLTPTGRSIGRYAWIPAKMDAFVGAGGGVMFYKFQQSGDFIDFATANNLVYADHLATSGWTPTAHALAGVDYTLSPMLALTGEGRYTWARGDVNHDYVGFDRIDLSGLSATVGLSVRF